jgi:succinyl-diaminopimelate desuccinylase
LIKITLLIELSRKYNEAKGFPGLLSGSFKLLLWMWQPHIKKMTDKTEIDPFHLARKLISFNTIGGQCSEMELAYYLADILENAGYKIKFYEFEKQRTSFTADLIGGSPNPVLCFNGHLDSVPLGRSEWSVDPFSGEASSGKLYGRGSSDMKSGLAALVNAAVRLAEIKRITGGIHLVFCAGEESGMRGSKYLSENWDHSFNTGMIICAEPTSNYPMIGHKGALWIKCSTKGRSAHGSSPDLGINAIYEAAEVILRLRNIDFHIEPHPLLGAPTVNVGTFSGGTVPNKVPDFATFEIDIRTVPGKDNERYLEEVKQCIGPGVIIDSCHSVLPIKSDEKCDEIRMVYDVVESFTNIKPEPKCVAYATDCSYLTPAYGNPPTVIMGPGEPEMAHACDEYCFIDRIYEAADIYFEIGRRWLHID